MAETNNKDGRWVTLDNGVHLFIKKGQTLDDAIEKLENNPEKPKEQEWEKSAGGREKIVNGHNIREFEGKYIVSDRNGYRQTFNNYEEAEKTAKTRSKGGAKTDKELIDSVDKEDEKRYASQTDKYADHYGYDKKDVDNYIEKRLKDGATYKKAVEEAKEKMANGESLRKATTGQDWGARPRTRAELDKMIADYTKANKDPNVSAGDFKFNQEQIEWAKSEKEKLDPKKPNKEESLQGKTRVNFDEDQLKRFAIQNGHKPEEVQAWYDQLIDEEGYTSEEASTIVFDKIANNKDKFNRFNERSLKDYEKGFNNTHTNNPERDKVISRAYKEEKQKVLKDIATKSRDEIKDYIKERREELDAMYNNRYDEVAEENFADQNPLHEVTGYKAFLTNLENAIASEERKELQDQYRRSGGSNYDVGGNRYYEKGKGRGDKFHPELYKVETQGGNVLNKDDGIEINGHLYHIQKINLDGTVRFWEQPDDENAVPIYRIDDLIRIKKATIKRNANKK